MSIGMLVHVTGGGWLVTYFKGPDGSSRPRTKPVFRKARSIDSWVAHSRFIGDDCVKGRNGMRNCVNLRSGVYPARAAKACLANSSMVRVKSRNES